MTMVLMPLWLWAVARRRFTDVGTFSVRTAGMVGFCGIALLCAAAQPRSAMIVAASA
jgi:hypothetical protein